jgi:alcohol dehydrogenase class IV
MGAVAFQKGLGAMHAMAHAIGGLLDAHHGLTIAVVMPYVLVRNRPAIEGRMMQLARTLRLEDASFEAVLDRVLELRRALGIPDALGALGVREEQLALLAPRAAADPSAATNPIPLGEADYVDLYRAALVGRLD